MNSTTSLRSRLRTSILKQTAIGIGAMAIVLVAVTYFLGRYKAADELVETANASTKAFRGKILDGEISITEKQLREVLNIREGENVLILDQKMVPVYQPANAISPAPACKLIGVPCISAYGSSAEILMPIYFDETGKTLFGYLYILRNIRPDWIFISIVFVVFSAGYSIVFLGVTRATKSTMEMLADSLEIWSNRLSVNPKDSQSLAEAPFRELLPLKAAIKGLNQKIEEFESKAAEKAKLLVLRGIAHDLLGPVSQVQLYLATLKVKASANPELAPIILDSIDSIRKVSTIASQVKALQEIPNPEERLNLLTCIQDEIRELRRSKELTDKQIGIDFKKNDFSVIDVSLSRAELARILQNLLHNSAHASSAGSRVEIAIKREADLAVVSVRDRGHGIPKDIQEKVFHPDFTLKPGTGTGLGLAIVKHLVEARGGHVVLNSEPGAGTVVEVKVPIFPHEGAIHDL